MSKFKVGDRVKYKSWCDHIVVGNVEKVCGTGTYEVNGVYVEEQQLTKVDSPLDPYIRSFLAYSLKLPKWDLEIHSYGDKRYEIDYKSTEGFDVTLEELKEYVEILQAYIKLEEEIDNG